MQILHVQIGNSVLPQYAQLVEMFFLAGLVYWRTAVPV